MKYLFFCLSLVSIFGFCGCSSQQKSKPKALVNPSVIHQTTTPVEAIRDTTNLVEAGAVVEKAVNQPDTTFAFLEERELSPEEKVIEQKTMGMYRHADWAPAIHYDLRKPNFVILHHTSQNSVAQTVRTFQLEHTKVSAHYIIGKDGQIIQMLNDYERGWHAGRSKWGAVTDLNSVSIGIELDNNGREPFPEQQIGSLLVLLDTLKTKYNIPQTNFIGHADVAPTRKNDPSIFFPWKQLAQHGFGIWYNEDYLLTPPANFNPIDAFKIIGYDTSNLEATIRAFKQKYIVTEVDNILTEYDKAVLYDLYRKYY